MGTAKPTYHKQADEDIKAALAKVMQENPGLGPDAAMLKTSEIMLKNNPFVPPKSGSPINDLPNELLAYIFYVGMRMQEENEEHGDSDDDDDEEDMYGDDNMDLGDPWTDEEDADINDAGEIMDVDIDEAGNVKRHAPSAGDSESSCSDSDCQDHSHDDEDDDEPRLPFQVLVSHVCRQWRQVALNEPSLWTTVRFRLGAPFDAYEARIHRSKGLPLDIEISAEYEEADCTDDENEDEDGNPIECKHPENHYLSKDDLTRIFDLLVPHIDRWHELSVVTGLYETMFHILTRLSQCPSAPLLEVLALSQQDEQQEDDLEVAVFQPAQFSQEMLLFQGQLPKLQKLDLWGVHINWDASLAYFSGLHDVSLAWHANDVRPSFATFSKMLQASPNLRTLILNASGPRDEPELWGSDPIVLPAVQALVLSQHKLEYINKLFPLLQLPNVRDLVLDFDGADYSDFVELLLKPTVGQKKGLVDRLEKLKICGLPCDRAHKAKLLQQASNLKAFNIVCLSDEEEQMFEVLFKSAKDAGETTLCPNLEMLTTAGLSSTQVRQFLEARKTAGKPIKRVWMSRSDEIEVKDRRWFDEHLDEFELFDPEEYSEDEDFIEIDEDLSELDD